MKSSIPNSQFKNPVINWIDTRLPIFTAMNEAVGTEHPTPKKFKLLVEFWLFSGGYFGYNDYNWYSFSHELHCSCRSCF